MPAIHTPVRASLLLATLMLTSPAWSADPVHKEKMELSANQATHSIKGKIKGYATAEYTVTGKAGQILSVKLKTNSMPASASSLYSKARTLHTPRIVLAARPRLRYLAKYKVASWTGSPPGVGSEPNSARHSQILLALQ